MITAQEASSTGCLALKDRNIDSSIIGNSINAWNNGSCPDWMNNYLFQSTLRGGSYDDNIANENEFYNYDYWTMSAYSESASIAWLVDCGGRLYHDYVSNNSYGARAVVVISK